MPWGAIMEPKQHWCILLTLEYVFLSLGPILGVLVIFHSDSIHFRTKDALGAIIAKPLKHDDSYFSLFDVYV